MKFPALILSNIACFRFGQNINEKIIAFWFAFSFLIWIHQKNSSLEYSNRFVTNTKLLNYIIMLILMFVFFLFYNSLDPKSHDFVWYTRVNMKWIPKILNFYFCSHHSCSSIPTHVSYKLLICGSVLFVIQQAYIKETLLWINVK